MWYCDKGKLLIWCDLCILGKFENLKNVKKYYAENLKNVKKRYAENLKNVKNIVYEKENLW